MHSANWSSGCSRDGEQEVTIRAIDLRNPKKMNYLHGLLYNNKWQWIVCSFRGFCGFENG